MTLLQRIQDCLRPTTSLTENEFNDILNDVLDGGLRDQEVDSSLLRMSTATSLLRNVLRESAWIGGYRVIGIGVSRHRAINQYRFSLTIDQLDIQPIDREDFDPLIDPIPEFFECLQDYVDISPILIWCSKSSLHDLSRRIHNQLIAHPVISPLEQSRLISIDGFDQESYQIAERLFGIHPSCIYSEWSHPDLTTSLYGRGLIPEYTIPTWVRVKFDHDQKITIIDLANSFVGPIVATEDRGILGPNGGLVVTSVGTRRK